jgi:hypothetical protein
MCQEITTTWPCGHQLVRQYRCPASVSLQSGPRATAKSSRRSWLLRKLLRRVKSTVSSVKRRLGSRGSSRAPSPCNGMSKSEVSGETAGGVRCDCPEGCAPQPRPRPGTPEPSSDNIGFVELSTDLDTLAELEADAPPTDPDTFAKLEACPPTPSDDGSLDDVYRKCVCAGCDELVGFPHLKCTYCILCTRKKAGKPCRHCLAGADAFFRRLDHRVQNGPAARRV